ncbi:TetR/AcrR family transcriptional regulator [Paracrocinitomix mangrovi]|uniref:TetR/AcrR family transcriptional regulator n=1 Tax=Paracrocinitomix mangrovi TaxID=2862509 RepID=UPI001C8D674F|nr:TetR/AcrR family transcriptional regulator [Paracrocinitomix mangrovi]UKN01949.1 TetR/AcrR family transcriptional regulator [Paracrocinitomix mangrovi]
MEAKKNEILMKASEVYMRFGIKSVTMDDMARQLGVSKKTLYQFVKDKNDLVEQCVKLQHTEEHSMMDEIVRSTDNAIEQILKMSRLIIGILNEIHPSIFFDLEKYHPSAMQMMQCHKDEFVGGKIEGNLKLGIEQGLYRENINPKVIAAIYVSMIDFVLGGESMKDVQLKRDEVYSEMFRYHIRGIASEKGLKVLKELIEKDGSLSHEII